MMHWVVKYGYKQTVVFTVLLVCCVPAIVSAAAKSFEYGNVTISEYSKENGQEPVIFRHWIHRSRHTCRLCHVDIEFAMATNDTGITEEDNRDGRYCGTCHNGKEAFDLSKCQKCHPKSSQDVASLAKEAKKKFFDFKKTLPKSRYGNKIDWTKADQEGKVIPKDFLENVSSTDVKLMVNDRDIPRSPKLPGLPDIIFSHSKHVVWNGCGMCHPDKFALETGKTKMSMKEIIDGKFCGACHGSVAFPLNDCSRCHSKPVSF